MYCDGRDIVKWKELSKLVKTIGVRKSNPILKPIKIVKTWLNLLLLGIKLRSHEWQAGMLTLVLQRPWNIITRVISENTHQCTTTTTSENILFVNTQYFINKILRKAIQFGLSSNYRCWGSNPNYRHDKFTTVQFRV